MAEHEQGCKWEGKASVEITGVKPDQIWLFIADFCNIHRWASSFVDYSYLVEGTPGKVGVVRRCTSKALSVVDRCAERRIDEKLVELDHEGRSMRCQVLENNIRIPVTGEYVGAMRVLESPGGGCKFEWSFVSEPMTGLKLEVLCAFMEANIKPMADELEAAANNQFTLP